MKHKLFLLLFLFSWIVPVYASYQPAYSVAGFYPLDNTGREVYSMNPAWRFYKGSAPESYKADFDDSAWEVVSLPNGIEYLPLEASGCVNYQGEVWYRKRFTPEEKLKGKELFLHFEGIMGKSKVWVNGQLVTEHFGGFLPVIANITSNLKWGKENVITVCADNSDDPSYPPGKAQDVLDFSYFGGIYRDCWLIAHNDVYITDPNDENQVAGGGLFVSFGKVSDQLAEIQLQLHVRNNRKVSFDGQIVYELYDAANKKVASAKQKFAAKQNDAVQTTSKINLKAPQLWSPESPYLYQLCVYVKDNKGKTIDGYRRRVGVRSIEFKGADGFWLNGKPYEDKLIGANRHQDFAVIGNALSNSMHWRDAKKLRSAGLKVIRNAHYPQDPAFMDACDELGLFVIVNTPGWQFWNDAPEFAQRVYSDIRNMVRRDRNHPSVWLWEPILNETHYPGDFSLNAKNCVMEEYPHPYCYTACDAIAKGHEYHPVLFGRPAADKIDPNITYFVREWGDNVDDWNSHNSPSRANIAWGETPMLIQADGYLNPTFQSTCYEMLCRDSRQHVGGCLWHSFDHQRGYHPDPFYGGLMDAFRQPKYSYYAFQAQRTPEKSNLIADNGPMVYIANAMTPFSSRDVTVYSNCDEVRLTNATADKTYNYVKVKRKEGMLSPVITFKDVFDVMKDKNLARKNQHEKSYLLAEGIIDGKVVATHKVYPARRPSRIILTADSENLKLEANGSDYVTVIAAVADEMGNVKRLNNYNIRFEIEGEGELIGDASILVNPRPVEWGTAPILVRSTTTPGKIKIRASVIMGGKQMPADGVIELESFPASVSMIYDQNENMKANEQQQMRRQAGTSNNANRNCADEIKKLQMELNRYKLKEVEQQQTDFGEKNP